MSPVPRERSIHFHHYPPLRLHSTSYIRYVPIFALTVTVTTTASFRFFYVCLVGVLAATAAVEIAVSYFERQLLYDTMDAELRAAQASGRVSTSVSSKIAPYKAKDESESVEAPKRHGSFRRHNSKTNGFAFAHPEGGDINQRSLSFIGIRHAVSAFDKRGDDVVELEEKVP